MAYFADRVAVIGKLESVSGTPETLTASDFNAIVYDPEYTPMTEMEGGLVPAIGSHAKMLDYSGARAGQIKFKFPYCPGAAASTSNNYSKFLQAAGHKAAAISTTGFKHSPLKDNDEKTMTLWLVHISRSGTPVGVVHKIAGAMADGSIGASGVGKDIECELTFTGKHVAPADLDNSALTALNVLTSPDVTLPYRNSNVTIKINNTARKISAWKLAFGNKVEPEIDTADATGGDYSFFAITERNPTFSCNPLMAALSAYDPITLQGTMALNSIDVAIASRTPGMSIIMPAAQVIDPKITKREGLAAYDVNYKLEANGLPGALIDSNLAWDEPYVVRQGTVA